MCMAEGGRGGGGSKKVGLHISSVAPACLCCHYSELKGDTLFARLHKYGHEFTGPSKAMILKQIIEVSF